MNSKDIFSNCSQLRTEIEQATNSINSIQHELNTKQQEIEKLQNAKIAARLEFGTSTEKEIISQLEQTLIQLEGSIATMQSNAFGLQIDLSNAKNQRQQLQSSYNTMGCANII